MTPPGWPADGTLRLSFGVELAHEPGYTPRDLVARLANGVDRLSLRVPQVPVQVAPGVVEADEEDVRHLVALPPDHLVRERTEGRPGARRRNVDPQVVPVPRGERRTERPSGVHRRAGDRAAEDRVEPHGAADRDR